MKPLLTSVDAVLFDLDGTLVETNIDFPSMKQKMVALAEKHGVEIADPSSVDILGVIDFAARRLESTGRTSEADQLRHEAGAALEEIELRHARGTRQVPFARELVEQLHTRGIKVGVVTRNCRSASELSLETAQIKPDVLICREHARNRKPHPEQLHKALDLLQAQAERSIMVGDHIIDVESGRAAGMKTIGLLTPERPTDFFDQCNPDFVAGSLEEVMDAVIGRDC